MQGVCNHELRGMLLLASVQVAHQLSQVSHCSSLPTPESSLDTGVVLAQQSSSHVGVIFTHQNRLAVPPQTSSCEGAPEENGRRPKNSGFFIGAYPRGLSMCMCTGI